MESCDDWDVCCLRSDTVTVGHVNRNFVTYLLTFLLHNNTKLKGILPLLDPGQLSLATRPWLYRHSEYRQ